MKRVDNRKLISLSACSTRPLASTAVVWTRAAHAQQGDQVRRIGAAMSMSSDDPEGQARLTARFAPRRFNAPLIQLPLLLFLLPVNRVPVILISFRNRVFGPRPDYNLKVSWQLSRVDALKTETHLSVSSRRQDWPAGLASVDDLLTCSEVITRKIPGKQSRRLSPSFNAR
jgi:hypothetical protein